MNRIIGTSCTIRPPMRRATTDVAASDGDGELCGARVGAILDELDELLDPTDLRAEGEARSPTVTATKNLVRTARS